MQPGVANELQSISTTQETPSVSTSQETHSEDISKETQSESTSKECRSEGTSKKQNELDVEVTGLNSWIQMLMSTALCFSLPLSIYSATLKNLYLAKCHETIDGTKHKYNGTFGLFSKCRMHDDILTCDDYTIPPPESK